MSWQPCPKCGSDRKVDIAVAGGDGYLQPACHRCDDPAHFEPFELTITPGTPC